MASSSTTQEGNKEIAVVKPVSGLSAEIKEDQVPHRNPATVSYENGNQIAYQNTQINVGPFRSSRTKNYTFVRFDYNRQSQSSRYQKKTFERFNNDIGPSRSSRIQYYTFVRFDYDN